MVELTICMSLWDRAPGNVVEIIWVRCTTIVLTDFVCFRRDDLTVQQGA